MDVMTRIAGEPECPICHKQSSRDDAFLPELTDGLDVDPVRSMFHSPAFHWRCYLTWPGRNTFARDLFNQLVANRGRSTLHGRTFLNDDIAVFTTVYEPHAITIILRETGRSLTISVAEWLAWQTESHTIASECHAVERDALSNLLPTVWAFAPDLQSLIDQTDWSGTERNLCTHDE